MEPMTAEQVHTEPDVSTEVTAFIDWVQAGEISLDAIIAFVTKNHTRDAFLEQSLLPKEKQALGRLHEHLVQTSLDVNEAEDMAGVFAIQFFYRNPLHPFLTTRPAPQRSQSPP